MENVTTERFKELQSEGNKLVVDFWAEWCGPCKTLIPRLEQMEKDYPNVKFIKVNVDENMDASLDMGIRSVPTVMIFDSNKLVDRSQGVQSDTYYKEVLNKL
jgi:thioredoxin 1